MSYVRTILSENHHNDGGVTRRYVMETIPVDENSHLEWRCDSKLIELELSLSPGAAIYFQDIPYTLAEAIWVSGIQGAYCCYPFCCADYQIPTYEQEAYVDDKTDWESRSAGEPIILDVYTAWDELAAEHRLTAAEVLNVYREIRQMGEQGSFCQVQHALSDIGYEPIAPWRWRSDNPISRDAEVLT